MPLNPLAYTAESSGGYIRNVEEIFTTRGGTQFKAGLEVFHRDYERKFRVITTNNGVGSAGVCTAVGIQKFIKPWTIYQSADGLEWDELALAVSIGATREHGEDDWQNWIVTVGYSTNVPEFWTGPPLTGLGWDVTGAQNHPEQVPPELEWDFEVVTKAPPADLDGKAFVNSATQPYKPAPSFEYGRSILVVTKNQLTFDRPTATKYAFAVNSDTFMGNAPGTCQCFPIKAKQKRLGTLRYWRCQYRVRFGEPIPDVIAAVVGVPIIVATGSAESFEYASLLDEGYSEISFNPLNPASFGLPVQMMGPGGAPLSSPDLLNGSGRRQTATVSGGVSTRVPKWNKFRVRNQQPFAAILGGL